MLPAAGGRVSIAEYGIFTAPYQTRAARSIRAETWKPEFQVQPSSCCGLWRSISRSVDSPCGEISNSLYRLTSLKSAPMKTSATSQFHNPYVPVEVFGFGLRLSCSYGHTNKK